MCARLACALFLGGNSACELMAGSWKLSRELRELAASWQLEPYLFNK